MLNAVKHGDMVFIVEGEKDVLALEAWGCTATCNAGGAEKWRRNHSRALQGARVVILPDNDEAGRRHAEQVAADLLMRQVPVPYLPDAPCPRWEHFLHEVFQGDIPLITFVQRMAGYLLTGNTKEHVVFFLVGKGANGKSVFVETLRALMADYAQDTNFAAFLDRRDNTTADLAALVGARLVTASEADGGQTFNEALLKPLTGEDVITCRHLYRDFFTYDPNFKLLFATNEIPRIASQGYAMKRRLRLLPFRQTFYAPEEGKRPVRDDGLRDHLRHELPGILAWAVRGCLVWQDMGLLAPDIVLSETAALFDIQDPLADYLETQCYCDPTASIEVSALWRHYLTWCTETQRTPAFRATNQFSRNLLQREGISSVHAHAGRYLTGIGIQA